MARRLHSDGRQRWSPAIQRPFRTCPTDRRDAPAEGIRWCGVMRAMERRDVRQGPRANGNEWQGLHTCRGDGEMRRRNGRCLPHAWLALGICLTTLAPATASADGTVAAWYAAHTGTQGYACEPCGLQNPTCGCDPALWCEGGTCVGAGNRFQPCLPEDNRVVRTWCHGDLGCVDGVCVDVGDLGEPCETEATRQSVFDGLEEVLPDIQLGVLPQLNVPASLSAFQRPEAAQVLQYSSQQQLSRDACEGGNLWCNEDGRCERTGGTDAPCTGDLTCDARLDVCIRNSIIDGEVGPEYTCRFASGQPGAPCAFAEVREQLGASCVDGYWCAWGRCISDVKFGGAGEPCRPRAGDQCDAGLACHLDVCTSPSAIGYFGQVDPNEKDVDLDLMRRLIRAIDIAYTTNVHELPDIGFQYETFWEGGLDTELILASDDTRIVVAIRGTEFEKDEGKPLSALEDFARDAQFGLRNPSWSDDFRVHNGFRKEVEAIAEPVENMLLDLLVQESKQVWITGHSLGGAVGQLLASRLQGRGIHIAGMVTFGAPKVGDRDWAKHYAALGLANRTHRVVNMADLGPRVPTIRYHHVGRGHHIQCEHYGSYPGSCSITYDAVLSERVRHGNGDDHGRDRYIRNLYAIGQSQHTPAPSYADDWCASDNISCSTRPF